MTPEQETELANEIVECGVGTKSNDREAYYIDHEPTWGGTPEWFIRDGRVVLTAMTKLRKQGFSYLLATMPDGKALMTITSPLPEARQWAAQVVDEEDSIAILEACVKALREKP